MYFATRLRPWRVARLCSDIAQSQKTFGMEYKSTYYTIIFLRISYVLTSKNIDLSHWDILYTIALCHIRH
jgi:hypothetical protein